VEQLEESYKQLRRDKKPSLEIAQACVAWRGALCERAQKRGEPDVDQARAKAELAQAKAELAQAKAELAQAKAELAEEKLMSAITEKKEEALIAALRMVYDNACSNVAATRDELRTAHAEAAAAAARVATASALGMPAPFSKMFVVHV
jgi:outer membrane protein TolC